MSWQKCRVHSLKAFWFTWCHSSLLLLQQISESLIVWKEHVSIILRSWRFKVQTGYSGLKSKFCMVAFLPEALRESNLFFWLFQLLDIMHFPCCITSLLHLQSQQWPTASFSHHILDVDIPAFPFTLTDSFDYVGPIWIS